MRLPSRLGGLILVILTSSCGDDEASGVPSLVLVDSIALQEPDTAFIGEPYDLLIASDGSLMVSDGFSRQLLIFEPGGAFRRSIGRKGSGPGEFELGPTRLTMAGDSLLYVADGMLVKKLEMPSGRFIEAYSFSSLPGWLFASGNRLIVGQSDVAKRTSFAFTDDNGATFGSAGYLPEILTNPIIQPIFGFIPLAVSDQRVATAYVVTNSVYITDLATGSSDSVVVPVVERWGTRPEIFAQLGAAPTQELGEAAMASSMPGAMHWLPSGLLAVVYADATLTGSRFIGSRYLSLVDADRGRACAEVRIPGPTDPQVTVGFHGDTLFVLSQPVDSLSAGQAIVHKYLVDASSCPGFE